MNDENELREAAIERINERRDLRNHAAVYVAVNILLIVIWAATGAGYFWPIWVIAGWGIGLFAHYWQVRGETSVSESEIRDEMTRLRESRGATGH